MRSETNIPPEGESGKIEASANTPEAVLNIRQSLEGLLLKGETEVPEAVVRCAERLQELRIWHQFSRNSEAAGCKDAAHRRNRLGHEGIPPWDELKSLLITVEFRAQELGEGKRLVWVDKTAFIQAHCRGDRELDFEKIRQTIMGSFHISEHLGGASDTIKTRISTPEESAQFGVGYGLVNPFLAPKSTPHLFDRELGKDYGPPGTVMTNAGNRTWGVEIDIRDIVNKDSLRFGDNLIFKAGELVSPELEKSDTKDIWGVRGRRKTIGILTGNPPRSGFELCELIGKEVQISLGRNSLGDISNAAGDYTFCARNWDFYGDRDPARGFKTSYVKGGPPFMQ